MSGVGIDELAKNGELDFCRHAPLFWIDSADVGPTVGTAGAMTWTMKCTGFSGHSGVPQNAINALSLGMEAVKYIQQRFYADFPYSAEAAQWNFSNGSSLKPTRVSMPEGGQKGHTAHSERGSGWGRRVGMGWGWGPSVLPNALYPDKVCMQKRAVFDFHFFLCDADGAVLLCARDPVPSL